MLDKIIFFPRSAIDLANIIVLAYPAVLAIGIVVTAILHRKKLYAIFGQLSHGNSLDISYKTILRIGKKLSPIVDIFKNVLIGTVLVYGSWVFAGVAMSIFSIPEDHGSLPRAQNDEDIISIAFQDQADQVPGMLEIIEMHSGYRSIRIIIFIMIAGFLYTLSFDNKIWKSVGSFILVIAFLGVIIGLWYYLWMLELQGLVS